LWVPSRPDNLFHKKSPGRLCCLDAVHAASGCHLLDEASVLEHKNRRNPHSIDTDTNNIIGALEEKGLSSCYSLVRARIYSEREFITQTSGTYVVKVQFTREGESCRHFITIDCWRGLVFDNAEDKVVRLNKNIRKELQFTNINKVWKAMVKLDRKILDGQAYIGM